MKSSNCALIVLFALVETCVGQQAGWHAGQINTTMCQWQYPRAAVIRDTMYLDGGNLWWQPGMNDSTYGSLISDGNPLGLVYLLNFSIPFEASQNTTSIFTTISKAAGGGSANNVGPQYYDGAMFANDYEWITYGGVTAFTDGYNAQVATSFAEYEAIARPGTTSDDGYILGILPDGFNRYVTNGGSVSIPSENLGFYFAGTRAASWGPIYYLPPSLNESVNADQMSATLIGVDMTTQQETWSNQTLPSTVPGRADPEVVWVPVSKQGVLVAIGGVIYPSYLNPNTLNNATENAASEATSPGFMTTVSVYDVATQNWYEQPTSGSPPGQLAQGCTVLASAQDGSSHNIYWYGGFDGLDVAHAFSDDVYVLSVPSFIWTKVYTSPDASHGRAGHRCSKPYPDQMLVVGGYSSLSGTVPTCVIGGIVQIYNLSSNTWMDSYDPRVWSNYSVPSAVFGAIGGSATGGATQKSPTAGFANSNMTSLFGTAYDTTKIVNWYPYALASTALPTGSSIPDPNSGTPSYLAPVLGVVLGLFFITLIIIGILLWRRRKYLRSNATASEAGTMDNTRWVDRWLSGTPAGIGAVEKAPTITTDESSPGSPTPMGTYVSHYQRPVLPVPVEMDQGTVRYEMDDTSVPAEMESTGMTPIASFSHSHGRRSELAPSNSVTSATSSISHMSPIGSPRADSPVDIDNLPRFVSGVSNMSESERGHLRGISETSVSTAGGGYDSPADVGTHPYTRDEREGLVVSTLMLPSKGERPLISPLTPPSAAGERSCDYLGAMSVEGTRRKSNFSEGLDEVEQK